MPTGTYDTYSRDIRKKWRNMGMDGVKVPAAEGGGKLWHDVKTGARGLGRCWMALGLEAHSED